MQEHLEWSLSWGDEAASVPTLPCPLAGDSLTPQPAPLALSHPKLL